MRPDYYYSNDPDSVLSFERQERRHRDESERIVPGLRPDDHCATGCHHDCLWTECPCPCHRQQLKGA